MPIQPVPIDAAPPVPSSGDPEETFDPMFEASLTWQREKLQPQANALAEATYQNTVEAVAAKDDAQDSAEAAAESVSTAGQLVVAAGEQADAAAMSAQSAQVAAAAAGAAAGLPALTGKALRFLRVRSDETGVEFAEVDIPPQLVVSAPIFADGSSALSPVSSGELIMGVEVNTGLSSTVTSVAHRNGFYIASCAHSGTTVATATNPAGPWTIRSFPSALSGAAYKVASDGGGGWMVSGSGGAANIARSADGISWAVATLPTAAGTSLGLPVGVNGVWLVQASNTTSYYRSLDGGATWSALSAGGSGAALENAIFRLGNDIAFFTSTNLTYLLGGTSNFQGYVHGLGFQPTRITPLPDNTCAFVDPSSGQVYLATAYNAIAPVLGVFCPTGYRPFRVNGVWLFTPQATTSGVVYTATTRGSSSRVAGALPYFNTVSSQPSPYAATSSVTVLPRSFGTAIDASKNGNVILIDHATSEKAVFVVGA